MLGSKENPLRQSILNNYIKGYEGQLDKYSNLLKDGNETWGKTCAGSFVHSLLELYVLGDLDIDKIDWYKDFMEYAENYETQPIQWTMSDNDPVKLKAKQELLADNAEVMVKGFIKQYPEFPNHKKIVTEQEFLFYFEPCDCWITGTIDLVNIAWAELADHKTSGKSQNLEATIQHYTYCLGYEAEYGTFPKKFTYYNLEQYLTKEELLPQVINVERYIAVKKLTETINNYKQLTKKYSEDTMPEEKQEIISVDSNQLNLSFNETLKLGEIFAASGLFSDARDAGKAIVKILAGRELGISPVASMRSFHIIKDKPPVPSASLMSALIKRSAKYDYTVLLHNNERCSIEFYENEKCVGISEFSLEDAETAQILKKDSGWKKYPKNMVFARALSNGFTWYCSELGMGALYNEGDFDFEVPAPIQNDSKPVQIVEVIKTKSDDMQLINSGVEDTATTPISSSITKPTYCKCYSLGIYVKGGKYYCSMHLPETELVDETVNEVEPETDTPGMDKEEFEEHAETIVDSSGERKGLHKELDLKLTRLKAQHKIGDEQADVIWSKNGLRIGKSYKIGEKEGMVMVLEGSIVEDVLTEKNAPWDVMSQDKILLITKILREIRDKKNQEISFDAAFEIAAKNGVERFFDTEEPELETYLTKLKG